MYRYLCLCESMSDGASRFSLAKHPLLMQMCKERGVAIEVCPISNEILACHYMLNVGMVRADLTCLATHVFYANASTSCFAEQRLNCGALSGRSVSVW